MIRICGQLKELLIILHKNNPFSFPFFLGGGGGGGRSQRGFLTEYIFRESPDGNKIF